MIVGISFVALGLFLCAFRSHLSRWAVEGNYKVFGIRFSSEIYRVSFLIAGLGFVVLGILATFQIIKWRL